MTELETREHMCDIGRRMYDRGFCAASDGNMSVRLPNGQLLCTPSGVSKGFMTPAMLCSLGADGGLLEAAEGCRPTSELKMHLRVYAERPDVTAVVHAHPPYATAHAVAGLPLTEPVMAEAVLFLGEVPLAPYAAPSTDELADAVGECARGHDAMLLANHGALTFGPDLTRAYFKMESLEFYARVLYLTKALGGPKPLNGEQAAALRGLREKFK